MSNKTNKTNKTNSNEAAPEEVLPKPKKEKKKGVGTYPFRTKNDILAQIQTDPVFAQGCVGIVYDRQTSEEQVEKTTKSRNARGFMSSHAVRGSELALRLRSGDKVSDEDAVAAVALASRYCKQIAAHFRAAQIASSPELQAVAEVFSAQ